MIEQSDDRHAAAMRALARSKLHLVPGALARVPTGIGDRFESPWAPVALLQRQLSLFPCGLMEFWVAQEPGHVLMDAVDRGYAPGSQLLGTRTLDGVAHVALPDLVTDSRRPLELVGHLLDHLIGCRGRVGEKWLSDGGGVTPGWRGVGSQLRELASLGYGESQTGAADPRSYFARGLAGYCHDRRQLNVVDPLLERLLSRTVMSERFWATEGGTCAY